MKTLSFPKRARAIGNNVCPCIHKFVGIVTHPRIYAPPTPLNAAIGQVEA